MILEQYYLACLSHYSYLIADETTGRAVIVDPQRDIDQYVRDAAARGLSIEHVILTHFHADFAAGHLELRKHTGATIHMGEGAEADFPVHALTGDDVLDLGSVSLKFLQTPGHTPEGICVLVHDVGQEKPHAVLTGDTLFIGDVGRPDLLASVGLSSTDLASMLYDSLHDKLLALPDETIVYPAHGAGSSCGKNLSSAASSTIGDQRALNYALAPMEKDEFVRMLTHDLPDAPAYFSYSVGFNKRERATLDESLSRALRPLRAEAFLQEVEKGAQVLDARDADAFAQRHLRGSINVGLGGQYASWAGSVFTHERPIVLVTEPGREQEAALRLGRIGFDEVRGYAEGGLSAFEDHPELLDSVRRVDAGELSRELGEPDTLLLDVRNAPELDTGGIEGSVHIPLGQLESRFGELPQDRRVVVVCAGGYRSSIAASMLRREGFSTVEDLIGGYAAWMRTVDHS